MTLSLQQSADNSPLGQWHGAPPAWHAGRPRLLVLPFAAYDYDGYQAVYARRLAEWLANRLHATEVVTAALPLLLGQSGGRRGYAALTRLPEPEQVLALGRPAGAEWAVFGRLNLRDQAEWEIFLLNLATGELTYGDQAEHPPERPLEALAVVGLQILRAMGVPPLDDDARSRLFGYTSRQPEAIRAYLLAADWLVDPERNQAMLTAALQHAFHALELDPTFFAAADLVLTEALARLEGDETEASPGLELLKRLAQHAPDYHKVPAAIGLVWQRGGNQAEAARAYREALRLSPGHPYYLFRLGVTLDALDDPEALTTLEQAVTADPANLAALDLFGARLANQGRLDEAIALWHHQLEKQPTHAPALTNLGIVADQQADPTRAYQLFEAALAADDAYLPALDRLADLAARRGEANRAIELLEQALRLGPDDPHRLERLARLLGEAHRPEQELATLNRLVALRPTAWLARYAIAARLRLLGRRDEAIVAYRQVLEQQPDHRPTLIDLGYLLGTRRELTEAARLLAHANALAPDDPAAAYNYAVVQMERGDWLAAERLLEQVKRQQPDDPLPDRVLAELARRRRRGY